MDWWSELWLNEGFATWVGWYAIDYFYPGKHFAHNKIKAEFGTDVFIEWNVWGQYVVRRLSKGMHYHSVIPSLTLFLRLNPYK